MPSRTHRRGKPTARALMTACLRAHGPLFLRQLSAYVLMHGVGKDWKDHYATCAVLLTQPPFRRIGPGIYTLTDEE